MDCDGCTTQQLDGSHVCDKCGAKIRSARLAQRSEILNRIQILDTEYPEVLDCKLRKSQWLDDPEMLCAPSSAITCTLVLAASKSGPCRAAICSFHHVRFIRAPEKDVLVIEYVVDRLRYGCACPLCYMAHDSSRAVVP